MFVLNLKEFKFGAFFVSPKKGLEYGKPVQRQDHQLPVREGRRN